MSRLSEYQRKRDFKATSEPAGHADEATPPSQRFVVQEHHARRLHWDFRLERDGVLVSWAVPKGIPEDPKRNHLAVHVEDHPLGYIDFEGRIPTGNYGAGEVSVWDSGTYETHKWEEREVMVTLHGGRVRGRYVLFQTRGDDWMIHRMDPPQDAAREAMPETVAPMLARLAPSVPAGEGWAHEFKWDGIRALLHSESGRSRLQSRSLEDITARYPELRRLGERLGSRSVILDGEMVALDASGRPSFERLQQRMGLRSETDVRKRMADVPVVFMIFDLLHLDGRSTMGLPYSERRRLLAALELASDHWQTPAHEEGNGDAVLAASRATGLEGVIAKRMDSPYTPGGRSGAWLKIKNHLAQELVIGGWLPGEGRRRDQVGALLVGYRDNGGLVYAGKVGTGFTDAMLERLGGLLGPLRRDTSPFAGGGPPRASVFVEPTLVGEFEFTEWTRDGRLRHPSFKGLRDDKRAEEVVRERPR